MRRVVQIEKTELSAKNSVLKRFATGNKNSLVDDPQKDGLDIRKCLFDYHKKNYSSNIMSLCVVGQ